MITQIRALSAAGMSHTMSAMVQPAKTPRRSTVPNGAPIPSSATLRNVSWSAGSKTAVCPSVQAMARAPARFATRTMAQRRTIRWRLPFSRSCSTGKTTVSVFSVKSCCRPSTTTRKPTL